MQSKPFIKWVGGKRQIADEIYKRFPTKFNDYFEPFIGGGAIYFGYDFNDNTTCHLNDYNEELYNLYNVVKHNYQALIRSLEKHENTKEYFAKIRHLDRNKDYIDLSEVEIASRFIYLNKTAFNGLYRVNKKGQFNTPFGYYKNPKIVDKETLKAASKKLQKAQLYQGDYKQLKNKIKKGDFLYLDPPYDVINKTSNFTAYTNQDFGKKEQEELKEFCDYVDSIGAFFMQSNANTDFINKLYKDYEINKILAKRSINSVGNKRGSILEVLIKNY